MGGNPAAFNAGYKPARMPTTALQKKANIMAFPVMMGELSVGVKVVMP